MFLSCFEVKLIRSNSVLCMRFKIPCYVPALFEYTIHKIPDSPLVYTVQNLVELLQHMMLRVFCCVAQACFLQLIHNKSGFKHLKKVTW